MKKKGLVIAGMVAVMTLAGTFTSLAGEWKIGENGLGWYQNDDGSYTKNNWQQIDGKWYHFNEEGYVQRGWWSRRIDETNRIVYCEKNGAIIIASCKGHYSNFSHSET